MSRGAPGLTRPAPAPGGRKHLMQTWLSDGELEALDRLAGLLGASRSDAVRRGLREGLEAVLRDEARRDFSEALARLSRNR